VACFPSRARAFGAGRAGRPAPAFPCASRPLTGLSGAIEDLRGVLPGLRRAALRLQTVGIRHALIISGNHVSTTVRRKARLPAPPLRSGLVVQERQALTSGHP
jgi:hypothetical protein